MKKIIIALILFFVFISRALAFDNYFIFGLRLHDNDYDIAKKIEKEFDVSVPVISLIYDDFNQWEATKLARTFKELWTERVYHISINPFWYSLKELIDWKEHIWWEKKYRNLFKIIKRYNVKVIFRSLHEMNWGWYSRSSDPQRFKVFWKMMWDWSREEWLDNSDILFDFSINSQDLPALDPDNIYQWWPVITCNQTKKLILWCHTFEDYYPGDEYVDLMWVTIYNWWNWARSESWASWRSPLWVINEFWYFTFDRMKKFNKPIFIDEAWSTSINEKSFNNERNIKNYKLNHFWTQGKPATWTKAKNIWIWQLKNLYLDKRVLWWAYFNADFTNWLNDRSKIGELDWSAIDPSRLFAYPNIISIFNDSRMLRNPTLYFWISNEELSSKKWIDNYDMFYVHSLISKYLVYQEWNILTWSWYAWELRAQKYQKFLEKKISSDPVFCSFVASKFSIIKCEENSEFKWIIEKKKIFEFLKKQIDASDVKLSNWWIWEKAEFLKNQLYLELQKIDASLINKRIVVKNMIDYLDFYEKNYLDLR